MQKGVFRAREDSAAIPGCGASYPATEAIRLTDVMVLGTFLLNKNAVYHP